MVAVPINSKVFSYEVLLGRLLSATWRNIKEEEAKLFLIELGLKEAQEQLAKGNEQNGYKINLTHNCPVLNSPKKGGMNSWPLLEVKL